MAKLFLKSVSSLWILALAASSAAAATPPKDSALQFENGIVAVVEDQVITVEDVRKELARTFRHQGCRPVKEGFDQYLERLEAEAIRRLIDRALIVRKFSSEATREIPRDAVDKALADYIKREFRGDDSLFADYLRSTGKTQADYRLQTEADLIHQFGRDRMRRIASVISPEMAEAYYRAHADRFYQEDAVYLRLIELNREALTDDELRTKAQDAIKRLRTGASFASLAQELSQDKRRERGGDWGWQSRADLKKEFSDILFDMEKAAYSDPIVVTEGAFILYVQDRRFAGIRPFVEVRPEIETLLLEEKATAAENQWLEKLRKSAYVKIY
jgi:peptidyl-prolyl cis-trans isomerase SurA